MAKYSSEPEVATGINIIGNGTEIKGNVNCNGDIRIDGILNGNLVAKGKLVIGETGKITGTVICKSADVLGIFEGKLVVGELLSLKATSSVKGDVFAVKLSIEPNSKFTGNCRMDEELVNKEMGTVSKIDEIPAEG